MVTVLTRPNVPPYAMSVVGRPASPRYWTLVTRSLSSSVVCCCRVGTGFVVVTTAPASLYTVVVVQTDASCTVAPMLPPTLTCSTVEVTP
ncbi:MAG: hypothetical protein IPG50_32410 [Myxococcales bacterium]|nr:hypothetical protein [Myxococcales bacterium]